jgi:hypothetical protein
MSFTRKLVLDNPLTVSLACYYHYVATGGLSEVVVTPRCLAVAMKQNRRYPDLHTFLASLAIRHPTTTPLHVAVHVEGVLALQQLCLLSNSFNIPIIYEIFDMPPGTDLWQHLAKAYAMRAVVHFAHPSRASPDDIAAAIGDQLLDCFRIASGRTIIHPGQLYLCDMPRLVLCPAELATASDPNEAALLKLFDNLVVRQLPGAERRLPQLKPTWETFKSTVKLVESGFRPSMGE